MATLLVERLLYGTICICKKENVRHGFTWWDKGLASVCQKSLLASQAREPRWCLLSGCVLVWETGFLQQEEPCGLPLVLDSG